MNGFLFVCEGGSGMVRFQDVCLSLEWDKCKSLWLDSQSSGSAGLSECLNLCDY